MFALINLIKNIGIFLVIVFGFLLYILSHQIGGFRSFVVLSGSMEPTLHVGSLVITEKVSPYSLTPLDIVTFIRPDNPKEFVTHRIIQVTKKGDIPVFNTFGDNNNTIDKWTVVGGAVVGKVITSIPYLGYILSFTQGKVGIVFLIILPSMMIIGDEIRKITNLIRSRQNIRPAPVLGILIASTLAIFPGVSKTNALMTDSVKLANNSYTVALPTPQPTITPIPTVTPTPSCAPTPNVSIENNGAGSTNSVNINQSCTAVMNQQNSTDVSTVVHTHVSTGGNTVSNNTSTSTSVSTSSSSSSVSTTTVTGSNH